MQILCSLSASDEVYSLIEKKRTDGEKIRFLAWYVHPSQFAVNSSTHLYFRVDACRGRRATVAENNLRVQDKRCRSSQCRHQRRVRSWGFPFGARRHSGQNTPRLWGAISHTCLLTLTLSASGSRLRCRCRSCDLSTINRSIWCERSNNQLRKRILENEKWPCRLTNKKIFVSPVYWMENSNNETICPA